MDKDEFRWLLRDITIMFVISACVTFYFLPPDGVEAQPCTGIVQIMK